MTKTPCSSNCRCGAPRARFGGWAAPLALVLVTVGVLAAVDARSEVFHSRESALRLAFPNGEDVESRTLVLDDDQEARIHERAGAKVSSRIVRTYVGHRDGEVVGYAFIETHRVRSLPETVMVVVDAQGAIVGTHLLAFHEPREYLPSDRWLRQFDGKQLDTELGLGRSIAGIAGSTLTAQAVTACVRRAVAIAEVCLVEPATTASIETTSSMGTR